MLWMLCCNSAIPCIQISTLCYLFLELLVDLIAICTTPFLRVIVDPMPKQSVVCFCVFIARLLRRLHNGSNASDISFGWPNLMIVEIL